MDIKKVTISDKLIYNSNKEINFNGEINFENDTIRIEASNHGALNLSFKCDDILEVTNMLKDLIALLGDMKAFYINICNEKNLLTCLV